MSGWCVRCPEILDFVRPRKNERRAQLFLSFKEFFMLRKVMAALVALLLVAGLALAADKEVKGKVIKVDIKKKTVTVQTEDGKKEYMINDETKFFGPRGGKSEKGIEDDRFVAGAEIKLVIAGNNKTAREVHLPERTKDKDKDKDK
jgi:hypothetical protein